MALCGAMLRARSGTIVVKFAVLTPLLLFLIGNVVDYAIAIDKRTRLQAAADAAAIAAAKEIGLSDFRRENVNSVASAVVSKRLGSYDEPSVADASASVGVADGAVVTAAVNDDPLEVNVTATLAVPSIIGQAFGLGLESVTVHSVARVVGRPNICVLGLDPGEAGTIALEQRALVTGNNCAVFSNSDDQHSIKAKNSASLTASLICARGGRSGGPGNFSPEPLTDCPAFDDPLADRPEPVVGACLETDLVVSGGTRTLEAGTYCGGLKIKLGANVTLMPGIYVIKDGPLLVDGQSMMAGDGVGFFFTGAGAAFEFTTNSSIDLAAPESGAMAGLLMFEARDQPTNLTHRIESDDARRLIGTIYLSRGELRVDASSPIADQSAYTAIVARTMRLYGGPHLVLNTNYSLTPVPVPAGIRGVDQPVTLVE
jgi:hypothetical protein